MAYSRSDLETGKFVWLLRLDYASQSFLFASGDVSPEDAPTDDNGAIMAIVGAIPVDVGIDVSSDILSPGGSARSVSFRGLVFPVDIAELVEAGHDFATTTGDLSLWKVGDSYSNRWQFLEGNVQRPEYGAADGPINLSIEENAYDDRSSIPGQWATVTRATFPLAGADVEGLAYPLIVGGPGQFKNNEGATVTNPGSTAIIIEAKTPGTADKLLLAGHEINVGASWIFDGVNSESFAVTATADGLGAAVSLVDISTATVIDLTANKFYAYTAGGLEGGITGAGDVLEYFLRRTTLRVDSGKLAAAVSILNNYTVRTFTDSGGFSAWDWIQDNLSPILPISFVSSGGATGGIYPIVWNMDAAPEDATAEIIAGVGGATRDGPIRYDRNHRSIVNEIRIDYAKNAETGQYQRFQVLRPDAVADDTRPDVGSYLARVSRNRYGAAALSFSSDVIFDDATAAQVLGWKIHALGFVHRVGVYILPRQWGALSPVTLTDAEVSLVSRVCIVRSVAWVSADWVSVELLIIENPARKV